MRHDLSMCGSGMKEIYHGSVQSCLDDWMPDDCQCFMTDAQSLRSLSGRLSTMSAAYNINLYVENPKDAHPRQRRGSISREEEHTDHSRWVKAFNRGKSLFRERAEARCNLWDVVDPDSSEHDPILAAFGNSTTSVRKVRRHTCATQYSTTRYRGSICTVQNDTKGPVPFCTVPMVLI